MQNKNEWFDYKCFKNTLLMNPIKLHCVINKFNMRKFPAPEANAEHFSMVTPDASPKMK